MVRIIDELDARILELLQENARMTQSDIAKAVGLAPSAVLERMRKLEAQGRRSANMSPSSTRTSPICRSWRLFPFGPASTVRSSRRLRRWREIPEVLEVHHVAGDDCYLLKVRARDAEHLGQLLRQQIATVPHVTSTRTTIVLGT